MRKIILTLIIITLFLTGCSVSYDSSPRPEQPKISFVESKVIVTDIDYRHWHASAHHYTCDITVYNDEYDLKETFHLTNNDAKECENIKRNDIIDAKICIHKIESTGEITNMFINSVKPN